MHMTIDNIKHHFSFFPPAPRRDVVTTPVDECKRIYLLQTTIDEPFFTAQDNSLADLYIIIRNQTGVHIVPNQ